MLRILLVLYVWIVVYVLLVLTRIIKRYNPSFSGTVSVVDAWRRSKEGTKNLQMQRDVVDVEFDKVLQVGDKYYLYKYGEFTDITNEIDRYGIQEVIES